MKLPYKGAGIALFYKKQETGEYSILLGKRINNPGENKWSIPGGGYETFDYTLFKTAQREFREETGINLMDICSIQSPDICRIRIPFFTWDTFLYQVDSIDFLGKTRISEFSELKFIPLSELKKYKLAFGVKKEVKTFYQNNKLEEKNE